VNEPRELRGIMNEFINVTKLCGSAIYYLSMRNVQGCHPENYKNANSSQEDQKYPLRVLSSLALQILQGLCISMASLGLNCKRESCSDRLQHVERLLSNVVNHVGIAM